MNFTRIIALVTKPKSPPRAARHSVRIIGGVWRGRRIPVLDQADLRPTPDRVRETLFNWLRSAVGGVRCLDLYAGSGALGLAALSRGAREAVFVERSAPAAANLRIQLERLRSADRAQVHCRDAEAFLREPVAPFDVVFLDPPFGQNVLARIVALLAAEERIAPGGLIYMESERTAGIPAMPPGWQPLRSKFAGEVGYHLARKER